MKTFLRLSVAEALFQISTHIKLLGQSAKKIKLLFNTTRTKRQGSIPDARNEIGITIRRNQGRKGNV